MYPVWNSKHSKGMLRMVLGSGLALYPTMLTTAPEVPQSTDECVACVFQRKGNLPYILRRAIHESGPDENLTFGHCFVCLRCPQPGNAEPIPWCRGWWPADPDGGDYEGDDGRIYADEEEAWDRVDCIPISKTESQTIKSYVYNYGKTHDYQVVNQGARSCLGYCSDVLSQIGWPHDFPLGDFTIPSGMNIPSSRWSHDNTETPPFQVMESVWQQAQGLDTVESPLENSPSK